MIKVPTMPNGSKNLIFEIAERFGLSVAFSKLLVSRGIDSDEKVERFIRPDKKYLYNPMKFGRMFEVVERITRARDNGETVVVYGDYDADGISATAILFRGLREFGIEAYAVVPERENGYGLTSGVLGKVLEAYCPDLIITVDCGISAVKEVEELMDLGVDVIITDHHEIPRQTPDCPIINCKLKDGYPFDGLSGAGVAYKLVYALIGEEADKYLDLAAVATIADSMPLTDENRIIVSEGLKLIKSGKGSKAIKALVALNSQKEYTATSIAYSVAPRINAAGRMGDAYSALLAFTSDDDLEIRNLCEKLNSYNVARQAECDELYKQAKEKTKGKNPCLRVIVLSDEKWKSGLIGIIAAKLAEEYNKPVILFSEKNGILHGSARSILQINIFKALSSLACPIESFGGHAQAAGVSIKKENVDKFENELNVYLCDNFGYEVFDRDEEVDGVISGKFGIELARELELFEPCGVGNRRPSFAIDINDVNASPIKYGAAHISFSSPYLDLMYFNGIDDLTLLNSSCKKTVVFEPKISVFNGREYFKGYVKKIFPVIDECDDVKLAMFENQLNAESELPFEQIDTLFAQKIIDEARSEIYGTLFVVNNMETLKNYSGLECFEKSLLKSPKHGNKNMLCYGLSGGDFSEYNQVVFLDNPLYKPFINTKVYVNTEIDGFGGDKLGLDRESMINAYLDLKKIGGGFFSVKDACKKVGNKNDKQTAFSMAVFKEIGLIVEKKGVLHVEIGKKCDLNSSEIYKRALNVCAKLC